MKKRLMTLLVTAALVLSLLPLGASAVSQVKQNTSSTEDKYASDWAYWSQGASRYAGMRGWGCRVVAYAKVLKESGCPLPDGFDPDVLYDWAIANGTVRTDMNEVKLGDTVTKYAKSRGYQITYCGNVKIAGQKRADQCAKVMEYLKQGYYVVLGCPAHFAYVGREASLSKGTPVLLNSWTSWSSSPYTVSNYSSYKEVNFTYIYLYKVGSQPALPVQPVTLTNKTAQVNAAKLSVDLAGSMSIPSGTKVTECGVCVSTAKNPTVDSCVGKDTGLSYSGRTISLWYTVTGLKAGTTYHYRYYVKTSGESQPTYGADGTFTVPAAHTHSYNNLGKCSCGASFPLTITALSQTMEVTKDDAPARKTPYGAAAAVKTYSQGSRISVVASTQNAYGHTWYQLSDGAWIYSESVKKVSTHTHSYNSVGQCSCGAQFPLSISRMDQNMTVCAVNGTGTAPSHTTPYGDAPIKTRYYKDDMVRVVGQAKNAYGNLWYQLSDGTWLVESYLSFHLHTFEGAGVCTGCKATYTLHKTDMNKQAAISAVNGTGTAPSHTTPYGDAPIKTRYHKGDTVTIRASAKNAYGNLWYQLSNGEWIVSSYVTVK